MILMFPLPFDEPCRPSRACSFKSLFITQEVANQKCPILNIRGWSHDPEEWSQTEHPHHSILTRHGMHTDKKYPHQQHTPEQIMSVIVDEKLYSGRRPKDARGDGTWRRHGKI